MEDEPEGVREERRGASDEPETERPPATRAGGGTEGPDEEEEAMPATTGGVHPWPCSRIWGWCELEEAGEAVPGAEGRERACETGRGTTPGATVGRFLAFFSRGSDSCRTRQGREEESVTWQGRAAICVDRVWDLLGGSRNRERHPRKLR